MQVAMPLSMIKNFFLDRRNLTLLSGLVLICINHFLLAYFEAQLM